eukprot:TRINITY_DN9128_c0_g1_i1.p1 TRINITY_DN9128_c0_g1~~TRINITY_DN9128_c0_g1_i1.p1  ORF type:complete len:387 (+),score=68.86 TRINITY_DN9128_c0_g1_i1:74-1234(+)
MEEAVEAFKELLQEADTEEGIAGCMKIIEVDWSEEQEEDDPAIYPLLVEAAVQTCLDVKAGLRIAVLNVIHEMANVPEMLELVSKHIVRLVEGALLNTDRKAIWDMVAVWKQSTSLSSRIIIELNEIEKHGEDKGIPLTFEALRFFGAEENFSQTIEEEWDKVDEQAAGKVVGWTKQVEKSWIKGERLPSPVKPLPPTKWTIDSGAVASFMDLLTTRITEALVDAPHLQGVIGDVLAHTTSVVGRVEKAKRLQALASQLSAVTNGRITPISFEEFVKPLLPVVDMPKNPYDVEEGSRSTASSEYDPLAVETPDLHPTCGDMDADTTLYLPAYTGQASTHLTPPSLGPSHVLCRIWGLPSSDWCDYSAEQNRCHPLRVLLIRRKKRE